MQSTMQRNCVSRTGLAGNMRGAQRCVVLPVRAQVQQAVRPAEPSISGQAEQQAGEEIYIGFEKGDYGPRAGRKGRVIKDDPAKYPDKEDLGFFRGATGGWAGGEAALLKYREQAKAALATKGSSPAPAAAPAKPPTTDDLIYVGFGKDDLEARKSGAPGRFIKDDPAKYPVKEDLGFFKGATGGFAGGEKGLKVYLTEGDVRLRKPGEAGRGQFSPVSTAGLLVLAGAGGGLLLNGVTDVGENAVKAELLQAPIDDNTRTLLLAAVALLGSAGVVAGARAAVNSLNARLRDTAEGAQQLVVLAGFGVALFFAARAILEL